MKLRVASRYDVTARKMNHKFGTETHIEFDMNPQYLF